ncbi:MAG: EthD domain-containing protein [Betaproteobacteria bacterium]|nr:EthD domain-containing protein [Betaproteobacteria bacterium]MBK8107398.1 EthD domain-containing protein [Betaproteobacteria bacterium]
MNATRSACDAPTSVTAGSMSNTSSPSAIKRTSLLRRRAGLSVEAFRQHWAGPHAAIAVTMGGLAQYTQNRVVRTLWNHPVAGYACDGIVELEFVDPQVMRQSASSAAVQTLLPADELRFMGAITLCRVPGGARQTHASRAKVMLAARLIDAASTEASGRLGRLLADSGCLDWSIEAVQRVFHRDALEYEKEPPHAFASLWFEPTQDIEPVFTAVSQWSRAALGVIERGSAWLCDPLAIVG